MLLTQKYRNHRFILASKSPRRNDLFAELGLSFSQISIDTEEMVPMSLPAMETARYLAIQKTETYTSKIGKLQPDTLLITADTVVINENQILGKPKNKTEAQQYLKALSGKSHFVVSGVCVSDRYKSYHFDDVTKVFFKTLSDDEINYYIDKYQPFDKAGAYGIQEWIGYVGITKIEGSYFNVMGLPVQKLAQILLDWNLEK
jgi:septum formation protein